MTPDPRLLEIHHAMPALPPFTDLPPAPIVLGLFLRPWGARFVSIDEQVRPARGRQLQRRCAPAGIPDPRPAGIGREDRGDGGARPAQAKPVASRRRHCRRPADDAGAGGMTQRWRAFTRDKMRITSYFAGDFNRSCEVCKVAWRHRRSGHSPAHRPGSPSSVRARLLSWRRGARQGAQGVLAFFSRVIEPSVSWLFSLFEERSSPPRIIVEFPVIDQRTINAFKVLPTKPESSADHGGRDVVSTLRGTRSHARKS